MNIRVYMYLTPAQLLTCLKLETSSMFSFKFHQILSLLSRPLVFPTDARGTLLHQCSARKAVLLAFPNMWSRFFLNGFCCERSHILVMCGIRSPGLGSVLGSDSKKVIFYLLLLSLFKSNIINLFLCAKSNLLHYL